MKLKDRLNSDAAVVQHINWINLPRAFLFALFSIADVLLEICEELKKFNREENKNDTI